MSRRWSWILIATVGLVLRPACGQTNEIPLTQQRWFEVRTAHFNIYSCGLLRDVYKLAGRLEQFCDAYSLLAGTNAVASPPIVVMAFPDHESLKPFLPLYQGKPGNIAGFFTRGSDENLIVLALPGSNPADAGMDVIFHEYAHLLFRRNDRIWPLWLKEGMAEIYSTFETAGGEVQIARPIRHHLQLLAHEPMMPLPELFAVTPKSPQYNERTRQGIFYAESWLLTDYLMAGDNPVLRERFGKFTELLHDGQLPEQAFTNALGITMPVMEMELRRYLRRDRFEPITLALPKGLASVVDVNTRLITPVDVYFHLGDELLRISRLDAAESYFVRAQQLAPASPLPYEGLGLVAAQREQHGGAVRDLAEALRLGSTSFLAYYVYAREKYRLTADAQDRYQPLKGEEATDIRNELETAIRLMPHFGPAHELLGFFEMVQGRDLAAAEQQLRLAIQLEPENSSYLFTLAQLQLRDRDLTAARHTLQQLLLPNVDAKLRESAQELIQKISKESR
jgi:tetratricopeptide (TPR) repeat protein